MDTAFFSERDCVALRYDLTDCGIYICAPDVLVLFSDNFDFQHIQRDFIRGVLSEEELGNKLFVHELSSGEYGAVCANLRAYAAISKDIMQRWLYPLCPDSNLLPPATDVEVATDYFVSRRCMCAPLSSLGFCIPPILLLLGNKRHRLDKIGDLCCLQCSLPRSRRPSPHPDFTPCTCSLYCRKRLELLAHVTGFAHSYLNVSVCASWLYIDLYPCRPVWTTATGLQLRIHSYQLHDVIIVGQQSHSRIQMTVLLVWCCL